MMAHCSTSVLSCSGPGRQRLGIIVPRSRIRASIHQVDPENTAIRRSIAMRRRVYHVEGPNPWWHVDTHLKLVRWKFVFHDSMMSTREPYSIWIVQIIFVLPRHSLVSIVQSITMGCHSRFVQIVKERMWKCGGLWWSNMNQPQLLPLGHLPTMNAMSVCSVTYIGVLLVSFVTYSTDWYLKTRLTQNETDIYCLHCVFSTHKCSLNSFCRYME